MADYYFDGNNGNDTTGAGTEANPYKSIKASTVGGAFNPANARFFIKRGTTVLMAEEIHPNGSFKFASYGPTTDPKGKVVYNYGGSYFLATGTGAASTDTIEFDQLQFEDAAASFASAVYQNNSGSGKIVVTDCDMTGFFNGVMTQRGTGHQILRCNITGSRNCGVMIEHAAVAAPSNMLIADNYIDASIATNDGIVLHNGTSDGYGNVIRDNTIISGYEQGIDVMSMFPGTHILRNVVYPNPAPNNSLSEIFCRGKNSVIKGNLVFTKTRAALQIDDTNITVACNAFIPTAGQAGGPSVYVLVPALGSKIFNNLFYMPTSYASSSILVATGVTTGLSKNNLFINYSASTASRFLAALTFANLATWDIDNNYYVQMPGSYATPWAGARTFADWIATAGTPDNGTSIVATDSPIVVPNYQTVGQRFNLQKLLTIAGDSPLVEVGQHINYQVDMNGRQFWNPPSIGPAEYVRPATDPSSFFFNLDQTLIDPITGVGHEINGVLASSEALTVYRQAFEPGGSLMAAAAWDVLPTTGYPTVESITQTTFAVDATSHAVAMPATLNAGDGVLILLTTDGSATVTTPIGLKRLYTRANAASVRGSAYAFVARGDEGGTTIDFVTSAAETGAAQVYRISNWNGTLAGISIGVDAEITLGSTVDMPAVTPYWPTDNSLFIEVVHTSTTQTVSSASTNYTNLTQTSSGSGTTQVQCASARRNAAVATEDPDALTMNGSGAAKVYNTIAIAPASYGARYEQFYVSTDDGNTLWAGMYTSQDLNTIDTGPTRAIIVCHGTSLDAAEYFNVVRKNLNDYLGNCVVIAPFFAESDSDPDTNQLFWSSGWSQLNKSDASLAYRVSSGKVLDKLIDHLYTYFPNLEGVILSGHSAGGQLINRYSACSQDTRNRYLVSAPSSYLYLNGYRTDGAGGWEIPASPSTFNDYKYGTAGLSATSYVNEIGAPNLRLRLMAAKVTYMVGADDTVIDSNLDTSAEANTQGANRVERQQLYYDYLQWYEGL